MGCGHVIEGQRARQAGGEHARLNLNLANFLAANLTFVVISETETGDEQ